MERMKFALMLIEPGYRHAQAKLRWAAIVCYVNNNDSANFLIIKSNVDKYS